MNHNTRIQALADLAVKRGDYRAGSRNYEAYIKSLMELPVEEIERRYDAEIKQEEVRKKTKSSALSREPKSQTEWSKKNSKLIAVRMMEKGDADILAALEGKPTAQEIRRLLRLGIEADRKQNEKEEQT